VKPVDYVNQDLIHRTWLEAADYAINEALYREGILAAITCDFDKSPAMPPQVYTNVVN
jgi:hypothetical protein